MEKKTKMLFALTLAALAVVACALIMFDDEDSVAADKTSVSTINEFLEAINQENFNIVLDASFSVKDQITVEKSGTIDFNGNTISSSYVASEGAIGDVRFSLVLGGDVTLKNGTYKGPTFDLNDTRGIVSYGNLTIEKMVIEAKGLNVCQYGGEKAVKISGSTISGSCAVCTFDNKITVDIDGSKLTGTVWGLYHNGSFYGYKATVDNSTISGESSGIYVSGSTKTTSNNGGNNQQLLLNNCKISGGAGVEGKFTDITLNDCEVISTANDVSFEQYNNGSTTEGFAVVSTDNTMKPDVPKLTAKITIKGGTYKGLIGLSSFYLCYTAEKKLPDNFQEATYEINGGSFTDIIGAMNYATSGATITLADDIELDERITVKNKAVTIDLNGKKITAAEKFTSHGGVILVYSEGELTIDDTSVNKTGGIDVYSETLDEKGFAPIWGAIAVYPENGHTAKLTVNAGEYRANYYAIVGSGNCTTEDRIEITINDGKFESPDGYGMYLPHVGITTINKGTFIAKDCAIEIRAGELSIKDGQFESTATEFSCSPNGNGTTTSGAVIAIAQHTTKKDITVNILGGVFEGLRALNESNPQNNDPAPQVNLSVTGGTFKGMIQSVDPIDFITGGSFSDLSGLAYVASGVTYNLVNDCTVDSDITVKAGTTLSIAKDVTLTTKGTITNKGIIDNKGTITNEGIITTVVGGINISGKLIMGDGSKLTVGGNDIIDGLEIKDGAILAINTNSKGGFDATLNGKATASKLDVSNNDTFTVAKGAELTMTGTFLNAGNVTIDGTLLMTDAGKLQVEGNGIVTINGTIDGGIIDITNVDKDVVCVLFKPNSTITSKIDGTDDGKTSIVVLFGIKAGKGGVSVTKGSVIVDGALVEGDVTVPSGSTSFVYGTLEPGATLTIENNAAVNPTGSGSLVVESGAKVVTNSGASIKSVTYKAGSELNGTTFDTDTRVTPEGNVLVAIKIYLNYDDKKLNVSADYVEAFAGDKYVDVLSGVTVSGVNSRITFSGWYNSLDEKITSDVVVPSGGTDVILTAHFTEKAKNTVINTGSNDGVDYSVVIAFIVLIGSMVFLCSVLRKR